MTAADGRHYIGPAAAGELTPACLTVRLTPLAGRSAERARPAAGLGLGGLISASLTAPGHVRVTRCRLQHRRPLAAPVFQAAIVGLLWLWHCGRPVRGARPLTPLALSPPLPLFPPQLALSQLTLNRSD